jgi:hypothetical protein
MSRALAKRLAVLEEAEQAREQADQGPDWLQDALDATRDVIERLKELLADQETLALAWTPLERNLYLLAWCAERNFTPDAYAVRWARRYPAVLVDFVSRLPEGLRRPVLQALADDNPLRHWLHHLADGSSSLPEGVSEQTLAALAWVYLDHGDEIDTLSVTCQSCGLERPRRELPRLNFCPAPDEKPAPRLPEFFTACPHCGSAKSVYTHLREATV